MKDDLRVLAAEIATHPIAFGIGAAVARWWIGDRSGGWRAFLGYVTSALLVAWATSYYLADEGMSEQRVAFWTLIASFIARDLLTALAVVAEQGRADPISLVLRVWRVMRGQSQEPPK